MTELHRGEFEALSFTRHAAAAAAAAAAATTAAAAAAAAAAGLGRPSTLNLETEAKTDGGALYLIWHGHQGGAEAHPGYAWKCTLSSNSSC